MKQEPSVALPFLVIGLIVFLAWAFGGWAAGLWTLGVLVLLFAATVAVALVLQVRRERKSRLNQR